MAFPPRAATAVVDDDPVADFLRQADAVLTPPPTEDPVADFLRQADAVLQEPAAPPPPAGPPPLSPLERDVMASNPATRIGQPLPDYVPPKPPPPVRPRAPLITAGHGGITGFVPPAGEGVLDAPIEGVPQLARGAAGLVKAAVTPSGPPLPGVRSTVNPKTGTISRPSAIAPATLNAGSDVVEGAFKTLLPVVVGTGIAAPIPTAIALAETVAGQQAAEKLTELAGGSPEAQRFAGNVGAAAAGVVGVTDQVARAGRKGLDIVAQKARTGAEQARAVREAARTITPDPNVIDIGRADQIDRPRAPEPSAPSPRVPPQPESPPVQQGSPTAPLEPAAVTDFLAQADAVLAPEAVTDPVADFLKQADAVLTPETPAAATSTPARKFASTQVDLPPDVAAGLQALGAKIPAEHLADEGKEAQPHVTVKYGLHDSDPEALRRVLADEPPITLTLGKTSVFPNGESNSGDVVKVDVDSPDLHRLNQKIADAFPHTDTHPDYQPHATVAYVKPGLGERYAGDASLEGQTVTVDRVTLSGQDGTRSEIPLQGTRRVDTAPSAVQTGAPESHEAPAATPPGQIEPRGTPERPAPASGGLQPEGQRPVGPRTRGPSAAQRTAAAEHTAIEDLVAHAQQGGHTGDAEQLRAVLRDRLQVIKDWDAEFSDSGHNPQELLRAIADRGGLSISKETALQGELRWLKEFQDTRPSEAKHPGNLRPEPFISGQVRGVRGVFHDTRGQSVDDMLTSLRQEPRFEHLETQSDLLEQIRVAATHEPEQHAVARLRQGLGDRWWESIGDTADAVEPDSGDASFNPAELEADVLDTGEVQPRLPEAGAVRERDVATPEFDAPFSLTAAVDTTPKERPGSLFDAPAAKPSPPGTPKKTGGTSSMPAGATSRMGQKMPLPATRSPLPIAARVRGAQPVPVDQIVQELTDLFDRVPVGVRRFPQHALGIYKEGPQVVRTKIAGDLQVVAHEFGHHLDIAIMRGSATHVRGPIAAELKRVGAPTSRPSYSAATQRKEGAAEFFRRWLIEPDTLTALAPRYLAEFDRYLQSDPRIAKGLERIRARVQNYLALPGVEQARLHVDFTGGASGVIATAQKLARAARTPADRTRMLTYLSAEWVDDLAAVKAAEDAMTAGRPIDITESAYVAARLAAGVAGKAEGFLQFGVRADDGTFMGRSFDDAIGPVVKDLQNFALYAAAVHAQEMHAKGIESGFMDPQIADTIAKLKSPTFDTALVGLRDFHAAKRAYMVRGGALSADQAKAMAKKWPDYVPFQRVQDTISASLGGKAMANRQVPVKRLKGSGRRVVNPLETIIRNTHAEVAAVETNRAMGKLVTLALKTPGSGQWLEEIPTPKAATSFNLAQVAKDIRAELDAAGVDVPDNLDFDTLVTVFTPQQFVRPNGDRIITWNDRGTRRWFQVHDPDVFDAITAIGPQGTAEVVKIFHRSARLLQRMATATVGFVVRNPIKDQFAAAVFSRAGYRPGLDFLRGLFDYLGGRESYQLYLNSGAGNAALVAADRDALRKRLQELGHSASRRLVDRTILHPLDGLRAISEAGETATRLGEFRRTLEHLGGASAESLPQAALNARDVTQDFARAGRQVRAWNRYTAFFSARVGGYSRLWQAASGDQGGGGRGGWGPKNRGRADQDTSHGPVTFLWKAAATVMLPSLLLWIANKDDDEYHERPAWERNYFWHVPLPTGGFVVIPKPFELGQIFGTSVELALDWLYKKDPGMANRLMDRSSALQLVQQIIPTAVMPWIQVAANYDFFRDRQIVSPWLEDLAPELQANRWTPEIAKRLGRALNLSPAKIETLVYGYGAGVGRGVEDAIDTVFPGKRPMPSSGPARLPGIGAFYRPPATSEAESLTEFYDARDALTGLKGSVKRWHEAGDDARARKEIEKYRYLQPREAAIKEADKELKERSAAVNKIFADPTHTPAEKRQALDRVYLDMIQIARAAMGKGRLAR